MVGWRIAVLVALVLAAMHLEAWAQDPPPTPQEPAPEIDPLEPTVAPPPGIEAIEVTGERLDATDIQDEAQAITAFSGADLDRASIVNVDSLQFNVPGLHVGQSGTAPIITLRGIGTENASLTGEPGVAFHVDGINMGRPAAARVAFFDLETLDVKRGPQGLLGGKNSTSGSINILTRKPIDEYEVTGDVLSGNYDRIRYRGSLNVPFGEFAAARVAYFKENRDGYLDDVERGDSRDPFDQDDWGLRAHFKLTPSDTFEWLFSANDFHQGGVGPQADVVARDRSNLQCDENFPVLVRPAPGSPVWVRQLRPIFVDHTVLTPRTACYKSTIQLTQAPVTIDGWVEPAATARFTGYRDLPLERWSDPTSAAQIFTDPLSKTPLPVQITQSTRPDGRRVTTFAGGQVINPHQPANEDPDPRKIYVDLPSAQENHYWGWSTQADWDAPELPLFGETHLKLLGGFQHTGGIFQQDFDATNAPLVEYGLDDLARQYTGEVQWSGMLAERLDWQTSLFYLHEKAKRDVNVPNLASGFRVPGQTTEQSTNNKSYGAALHGVYQATDDLRLSLGGRYIKDKKRTFMEIENPQASDRTRFRGCEGDLDLEFSPTGPRPRNHNNGCSQLTRDTMWGTGIDWRPGGGDHLLYAKLDRGVKSGGFQAGKIGTYSPERIWAYAAGAKSEFFDQRLRVNLEGFFYAYDNLQLVIIDGLALRTENTDARMHGVDLETEATPFEGLRLSSVISFIKTETRGYLSIDPTTEPPRAGIDERAFASWQNRRLFERDEAEVLAAQGVGGDLASYATRRCLTSINGPEDSPCGTLELDNRDTAGAFGEYARQLVGGLDDFSGNDLSRAPTWKATFSGEYEIPLGRFGSLTPRVQYTWQDDTYFRAFNRDFDLEEAYHLTNAKLIWTSPEQAWMVEAFVENIEDKAPKQNILVGPRVIDSPPLVWYGPPRFYGLQIGFHY